MRWKKTNDALEKFRSLFSFFFFTFWIQDSIAEKARAFLNITTCSIGKTEASGWIQFYLIKYLYVKKGKLPERDGSGHRSKSISGIISDFFISISR